MKHKRYVAVVIVLSLLVGAALIYTIWAYRNQSAPPPEPVEKQAAKSKEAPDEEKYKGVLAKAQELEEENDLLGARRLYEEVLPVSSSPEDVQREICRLNMKVLFSPLVTEPPEGPMSEVYTVKAGDNLEGIARKYSTTIDLLKAGNNIDNPRNIQIGDRYKVVTDEFSIIVSRSKNTLTLLAGEILMQEYPVGTGEYKKTPLGDFKIRNRIMEPPWRGIPYGDERNILGTRWMGVVNEGDTIPGYGIHGTWDGETIGKSASQGCIRMYNEDVEELFKIVPVGTRVKIIE